MRNIDTIIIHCAATPPTMDIGAKEINQWHRQRGFFNNDCGLSIGYHYVIRRDGTLEVGRPVQYPGAHATGHNSTSIGICLVGGIDKNKNPENNYTEAQWSELKDLVQRLMDKFHINSDHIIGHNQVAKKACPCFSVPEWVKTTFTKENSQ